MMSFNLINKGMWGEIYPLQKSQMGNPKVNLKCVFFVHMLCEQVKPHILMSPFDIFYIWT